jgi:diguanylate cyclase (GGDEF)-like protein
VLLVDVDHFKRINDNHGHSEGDRALRLIAQTLVAASRGSDIVCRYGGEEFCLILPGASLDSALLLAGRIREAVPVACVRDDLGAVTVTIGVATYPGDGMEGDAIMRAADRRLYRGKGAGRDRVVAD